MKNKKELILIILSIVLFLIGVSGVTYAYFSTIIEGNENPNIVTSKGIKLIYEDGTSDIVLNNMKPGDSITKTFTIKNESDTTQTYNLIWKDVTNTFVDRADLQYTLTGSNTVSNIQAPATTEKSNILSNLAISTGETHTYTLTLTWVSKDEDQRDNMGKSFSGTIFIEEHVPTLYNTILIDNEVLDSSSLDYSGVNSSTNGEGLYKLNSTHTNATTERGQEIYFFRGTHNLNNNVIFAGFCWKIVRTNWDGSVKLIYNGTPTNGQCTTTTGDTTQLQTSNFNPSDSRNAYVGYMYGTPNSSTYEEEHANTNDSTIKGVIDAWYENNLASYSEYLADPGYCGDRSISSGTGIGTSETDYMAYNRLATNKTPSLECTQSNDLYTTLTSSIGNKALDYPIALITADEVALAGGISYANNRNYYLYTNIGYWTMSPYYFSYGFAYMWFVDSGGYLLDVFTTDNANVRPVVSLNSSAQVSPGGTGSMLNPYVIE